MAGPLASRRILIVDDQSSIRSVLEIALGDAGAEVWSAADGATALELIQTTPPDVVLLDVHMPGMNGWSVIAALRSHPGSMAIPIALLTSAEDFDSFDRAKKLGVAAFLSKPFRLGEVIETCRRIFEGARPLQGRSETTAGLPTVAVRDTDGGLLAIGELVDVDGHGAQLDLEVPLTVALRVVLTLPDDRTLPAEVRWVTREKNRYQHGFQFKSSH